MAVEIRSLTTLRGLAALWVVGYHGNLWFPVKPLPLPIFDVGFLGVDVFFVLSGYVMTLAYGDLTPAQSSPFFVRRLFRLYPLHIAIMAGLGIKVLLTNGFGTDPDLSWSSFLLVLLLVQPIIAVGPNDWNSSVWSIGVELVCYVVFPFILRPLQRLGRRRSLVLVALLLTLDGIGIWSSSHVAAGRIFVDTVGLGAVLRGLCGFVSGGLLRNVVAPATIAGWRGLDRPLLRPLHWVGEVSYSIYLLQGPILGMSTHTAALESLLGPATASRCAFAFAVFGIVSVASFTFRFIEQPGRALARRLPALRHPPLTGVECSRAL